MTAARWRKRLDAANAWHVARCNQLLKREFARLLAELDPKVGYAANLPALWKHVARVELILATQKRAAAVTFGFMALEMLGAGQAHGQNAKSATLSVKAEPATRAERIAAVLRELARTVAAGPLSVAVANLLARDAALVSAVETAILVAPDEAAAVTAGRLLAMPRVAASVARAQATASGVADALGSLAEPASANPGAIGNARNDLAPGRGQPPGTPAPPPPPGGGGPPPRRSRFSQLVERLVREEAPQRARQIAATSGKAIAHVLGQAAREGWGEQKTARALEAALGGRVALHRAATIARTEIGSAQNAATLAMARDRAAAGEEIVKVWVAIDDARTRDSHAAADDQVRTLDQPFSVGEALLQHPGDPHGPLRELVNCRCGLLIRPVPQSASAAPP